MGSARSKIGDLCNLAFPLKIVNPLSAKRAKIDGACGPLNSQILALGDESGTSLSFYWHYFFEKQINILIFLLKKVKIMPKNAKKGTISDISVVFLTF